MVVCKETLVVESGRFTDNHRTSDFFGFLMQNYAKSQNMRSFGLKLPKFFRFLGRLPENRQKIPKNVFFQKSAKTSPNDIKLSFKVRIGVSYDFLSFLHYIYLAISLKLFLGLFLANLKISNC